MRQHVPMLEERYVDGVRCLIDRRDSGTTSACLHFAVGAGDETPASAGVAHMVEHLAMSAARHTPLEVNASVDLETAYFFAEGTADRVAVFLRTVCETLTALPTDRMPIEAGIIETEDGTPAHPVFLGLLGAETGPIGAGIHSQPSPDPGSLTPADVHDFAARWFTRENALLTVRGVVPEQLELPLSSALPPPRSRGAWRTVAGGPRVLRGTGSGAGVLWRQPWDSYELVAGVVTELVRDRVVEHTRHRDGNSYSCDVASVTLADGDSAWALVLDVRSGRTTEVVRTLVQAFRSLAADGPTDVELARLRAGLDEAWHTDGADWRHEVRVAMRQLAHLPPLVDDSVDAAMATTAEELQHRVAQALDTCLFFGDELPDEAVRELGLREVQPCPVQDELPPGRIFRPPLVARGTSSAARSLHLLLGDDLVAERDDDGVHVVRWSDVAAVMQVSPTWLEVIGRDGCRIAVTTELFPKAGPALEAVRRQVDSALFFEAPRHVREFLSS